MSGPVDTQASMPGRHLCRFVRLVASRLVGPSVNVRTTGGKLLAVTTVKVTTNPVAAYSVSMDSWLHHLLNTSKMLQQFITYAGGMRFCVRVCVRALKKWLELATPNIDGGHTADGSRSTCIDPKVKRSRSRGYQMRWRRRCAAAGRYDSLDFSIDNWFLVHATDFPGHAHQHREDDLMCLGMNGTK